MSGGGGTYNWDGASAAETLTDQERIFRRRQAKCSRLIDRTLAHGTDELVSVGFLQLPSRSSEAAQRGGAESHQARYSMTYQCKACISVSRVTGRGKLRDDELKKLS
jgi:hypothetical protein